MSGAIVFEFPAAWICGLLLCGLLMGIAWRQRRQGLSSRRAGVLMILRAAAGLALVFLVARPMRIAREVPTKTKRPVIVLVDKSESMSIQEPETTRYQAAVDFLRRRLLPVLQTANLPVEGMLFDQYAELVDGAKMTSAKPDGKRTNLGGAIAQTLEASGSTPLAIIALTDGIVNENAANQRASNELMNRGVPFIGVGFGRDESVPTFCLRRVEGPVAIGPHTEFNISAELEMLNPEQACDFELVLCRDRQVLQRKTLNTGKNSRTWVESFRVSEAEAGEHTYSVQALIPNQPHLRNQNTLASTSVRVDDPKELRVLYVQGALTWDYKFIRLALQKDSTIKMTGLTRTAKESVFRQNVENAEELMKGFPTSIEQLAPFRVVVLSNLKPQDLDPGQQELLARFCSESGGGVLLMGGPATFDPAWQNTRLEKILPVSFSAEQTTATSQFHVALTPEAVVNPMFQLVAERPVQEVWNTVPQFTQYGQVDSGKLGAQIWMVHPTDNSSQGKRVLFASQQYGAGLSAVLCLQNFWRWRLAKEGDVQQFDRFWRQLFRWLADDGREEVSIQLVDQELRPQSDIQVALGYPLKSPGDSGTNHNFLVQVEDQQNKVLEQETVELPASQEVRFKFRADQAGLYRLKVFNSSRFVVGSRVVEIRDTDVELAQTARDMESLRQWASVSGGLAFKVEDCPGASDLVAQIKGKVEEARREQNTRKPIGINAATMSLVLACLCAEWLLRKRWALC